MKISKSSKKRVYSTKNINAELKTFGTSRAQAYTVLDLANKKANWVKFKIPSKQASIFRMNIGKFVASEQSETTSAILATKRDRAQLAKKYEQIKG